jgi:hypothetical protein
MKRSFRILIVASVSLLALTSHAAPTCVSGAKASIPPRPEGCEPVPGSEPIPLEGPVIACESWRDCAVVELGCCDSCNGGFAVAVNDAYECEVIQKNSEICDGSEICTKCWCGPLFARCSFGECATVRPPDPVLWNSCRVASDCALVELGCCDHCNGGRAVSVNREYADEVRETMSDACGEGHACTLMGCPAIEPVCREGMCTYATSPGGYKAE